VEGPLSKLLVGWFELLIYWIEWSCVA